MQSRITLILICYVMLTIKKMSAKMECFTWSHFLPSPKVKKCSVKNFIYWERGQPSSPQHPILQLAVQSFHGRGLMSNGLLLRKVAFLRSSAAHPIDFGVSRNGILDDLLRMLQMLQWPMDPKDWLVTFGIGWYPSWGDWAMVSPDHFSIYPGPRVLWLRRQRFKLLFRLLLPGMARVSLFFGGFQHGFPAPETGLPPAQRG